jgi:alanyl-tRNA synthetase
MMTERLYYDDAHLMEFEARVLAVEKLNDSRVAVLLDRTAFYPTGGGQPSDTGTLGEARVIECIDAEDHILHIIEGPLPEIGQHIVGKIDRLRRLTHLQQHTGQHILSQAFQKLFGAETRGFRIMDRISEIDLALAAPCEEMIARAIELANQIVWEDRPIKIHYLTAREASRLALRREPTRGGILRLVEIEDFDLTPCGGTHAKRTGEVGLILARSWERAKRMTRLRFVAGIRALADYTQINRIAHRVALMLSSERDDLADRVARLLEENKGLAKRVRELETQLAHREIEEMLTTAPRRADGAGVIARLFPQRSPEALKSLALAARSFPKTVALLGSYEADSAYLIFARSADLDEEMNRLIERACAEIGGRGGGRADFAQGGGKGDLKRVEATLQMIACELLGETHKLET